MLAVALHEAKKLGAQAETINLIEHKILPHSGILNNKTYIESTNDDRAKLQKRVLAADGIVFATPTHWFNVSSLMKLFIDRLTSLEDYNFLLEGKVAGFISYGPQGGGVNAAMNMLMVANQMGMLTPPYGTIFDEGRQDKWTKEGLKLLAKNIILQIQMSNKYSAHWGSRSDLYKKSPIELL